jgi:nitric oxide reductase subunit B
VSAQQKQISMRALWIILACVCFGTFLILGFGGREIYRQAPPIPKEIKVSDGRTYATGEGILTGQQVWQSMGGQQVGSIWGHGAYQAPDWTADWLHRESVALLEIWSKRDFRSSFQSLNIEQQGQLKARLKERMRKNTYDSKTGVLTIDKDRLQAIHATAEHYQKLFGGDKELDSLRESYALQNQALPELEARQKITQFFFWTSWAASTNRPEQTITYTNNWPHEPLIGNRPSSANVLWSILSVILLIAGVSVLVFYKAIKGHEEPTQPPPESDPMSSIPLTESMKATKYFVVAVLGLFLVQVLLGALTAHFTVEGQAFFGVPVGEWLPYAVTRTWHIQTGIFWIATAFLGAGLFLAPIIGGKEPNYQALGVKILFGALLFIVVGSLSGEWLSIQQKLELDWSFWFGHQGYEYVDLGRFWQILLFAGLLIWLILMLRAIAPALRKPGPKQSLVGLFVASAVAIGLFYGAGFFYTARTHLSVAEYWRWWVVHLWVEGFFEVFATVAISFIFCQLGLVAAKSAGRAALFSTSIFLVSGIPGTFHHLYFSGTPVGIMAVGASFSALEVVPLVLIGHEAWETYKMGHGPAWITKYSWPIKFFLGVAFWNLVGAGLFGFLINPPISLYYMQGLNLTPVHAHTALFGVYGLLSLGLVLIILRKLTGEAQWNERCLALSFWSMNIGLALMVLLSLLPIGILQTIESIETGLWSARSAEFLQQPLLEKLRWMRIIGDVVFLFGAFALVRWAIGLKTGWSIKKTTSEANEPDLLANV